MKSHLLRALMLALGLGLVSAATASAAGIYQKQAADGAVELGNVSDDEAEPSSAPRQAPDVAADAAQGMDAQAGKPATAATASGAATEGQASAATPNAPDAALSPPAKYRETMLNLPLLPNGMPANPAIQRRYLMVKKSDYIGGN